MGTTKIRRMQPYTHRWYKRAHELALSFVTVKPCRECGAPVILGYCCARCGSEEP